MDNSSFILIQKDHLGLPFRIDQSNGTTTLKWNLLYKYEISPEPVTFSAPHETQGSTLIFP